MVVSCTTSDKSARSRRQCGPESVSQEAIAYLRNKRRNRQRRQKAALLARVPAVGDGHADERLLCQRSWQFIHLLVQTLAVAIYPGVDGASFPHASGQLAQDAIRSAAVLVVVADIYVAGEIDGPVAPPLPVKVTLRRPDSPVPHMVFMSV
jgi:hypothetical protein